MTAPVRSSPSSSGPFIRALCALVVAWSCAPGRAHAQSAAAAAEVLFNEGRTAMEQRSYDVACRKFRESEHLDPALGTELNLANCEEQRGRLATAWLLYRQVNTRLPPDDHRIAIVEQRLAALEPRVPKLRVVLAPGAPEGIRVRVGGLQLPHSDFGTPLPLDPGERTLVVSVPGRPDQTASIGLDEGETVEILVPLAGAAPAAVPAPPADDRVVGLDRRTAAYIAGGIGVTGLLVGTIAGITGLQKELTGDENCSDATRTCNQTGYDANQSARTLAVVSTLGFVVGIVGGGVGGYLYFTAEPPKAAKGVGAAAMGWRGTW